MPFFLVDDGFHGHPKIGGIPAGAQRERAAGLWSLAGSWSAKYLTEGRIPHTQVTNLGGTHATARILVDAGLWEVTEEGYAFHDWTGNGNPTREAVLAKRAVRAAAGARGGKASGASRRAKQTRTDGEANASLVVEPQVPSTKYQTPPTPPPDPGDGTDGYPTHIHHDHAYRWCARVARERRLPLDALALLAWCYRLGGGDPWAGHRLVDESSLRELDTAHNAARTLTARLRAAAPPRTENAS